MRDLSANVARDLSVNMQNKHGGSIRMLSEKVFLKTVYNNTIHSTVTRYSFVCDGIQQQHP